MTYGIETRWNGSINSPSLDQMMNAIKELEVKDHEHPETWMSHESGWTLTFHEKGIVIWHNLESDISERHILENDQKTLLELWVNLSRGCIEEIECLDWKEGPGIPPPTKEEMDEFINAMKNWYRGFYDKISEEIGPEKCKNADCKRLRIQYGVFCKDHHFYMIHGKSYQDTQNQA